MSNSKENLTKTDYKCSHLKNLGNPCKWILCPILDIFDGWDEDSILKNKKCEYQKPLTFFPSIPSTKAMIKKMYYDVWEMRDVEKSKQKTFNLKEVPEAEAKKIVDYLKYMSGCLLTIFRDLSELDVFLEAEENLEQSIDAVFKLNPQVVKDAKTNRNAEKHLVGTAIAFIIGSFSLSSSDSIFSIEQISKTVREKLQEKQK